MNRKLLLPFIAIAGVIGAGFLFAQTAEEPNEGSKLEFDTTNQIWRFKWWGKAGRTYFVQHSEDLVLWNWVPVVESGNDSVKEWGLTTTSDKFFMRLRHTDVPTTDPENDDFDSDGVPNLAEVMQGTNPFGWEDTDDNGQGDGLPDDWEIHHFGNLDYDGTNDPDGDELTNLQEFIYRTDPMDFGNLATNAFQDSDGNGLPDWWEILNFGVLGNDPTQIVPGNGGLTLQQIYDNDLDVGVSATLGDGIPDAWKIANGLSTTDPDVANEDPDNDGLTNAEEHEAGTNPNNPYSDSDTIVDGGDLYPLVADPTTPTSFYVAVPTWDEQYSASPPDWSAVDYTSVELRWEASNNSPANYIIERRADNDLWQELATVSGGSTTYEDDGLVANRHYQYRIRATKSEAGTQVSSAFATANYRVPLNLRLHAKTASSTQAKYGSSNNWNTIPEFTSPSTPPKYYLTQTDTSSYTQSSSSSGSSSSGSGSYSYTRTYDPMLKKLDATGTYSSDSQSDSWGTDWYGNPWSSSSTSSASSSYTVLDQARSPGVPVANTQRSSSYDSSSSSTSSPGSSSSSSSGSDGSYSLQGTYSPTDGPALWAGGDFDMNRGTVGFAGSSSSSSTYTSSGGSNSNSSASATASGTGYPTWAGISTNSSGNTSSITYAPYTSGWTASSWFYGLQSTTPTQRTYSQTSGSTQYQGTQTLSGEYTTEALIATTIAHMSDYPPEWTEDYWGWGYYNWGYWGPYDYWGYDDWYYGYGYYWWGWGTAQWSLSSDENSFSTGKFKYKFSANPSAPTTMRWAEIFVPYDDYDTPEINESLDIEVVAERTWQLTGSENESPEFEIDPTQNPPSRNGYYTILFRPVSVSSPGLGDAGKDITGQDTEPGKVVLINDGDADNDGIPDYADGYNLHSAIETDDACAGASFIPLQVGFYAIDPQNAKIKFTYAASNPTAVTSTSTNPYQLPATGKIRLWLKDANGGWDYDPATQESEFTQRDGRSVSQGGHFIEPGVEYTLEDLGIDPEYYYYYYDYAAGLTVYAEIVKTSDAVADIPVKVEIKPTANLGFAFSDQVRFTGVAINTYGKSWDDTEFTWGLPFAASNLRDFDSRVSEFGTTPGAFAIYQIKIQDPRNTIGPLSVLGQNLPLARVGNQWETPEFIFMKPGASNGYAQSPSNRLRLAANTVSIEYNPVTIERFSNTKTVASAIQEAYDAVNQAQQALKSGGWTPPPGTTNPGVFGNEVHQWVSEYFEPPGGTPRRGWVANVFVDNNTGVVVSIGSTPPGGVTGTTQIDLIHTKGSYRPVVNRPLNQGKLLYVFDIKTSARISAADLEPFVDRIHAITGKDTLYLPQVKERWSVPKAGWFSNTAAQRFRRLAKWTAALGVVSSFAAIQGSEAKADECVQAAVAYRAALKSGTMTDIDAARLTFFFSMKEFLSLYSVSPIQDGLNNLALMRWLLTEEAAMFDEDPEYDNH